MRVSDLLNTDIIQIDFYAADKNSAIELLVDLAGKTGKINNRSEALKGVLDREALMSTGLEHGIAIPHAKTSAVDGMTMALAISKEGIHFDSADGLPSYLFFLLLASESDAAQNIKVLAQIARLTSDRSLCDALKSALTAEEAYELIVKAENE